MTKNEKVKKSVALSALATGTVLLSSIAGASEAKASDPFSFETLGSGAELRSDLLAANDPTQFIKNSELELKCGEGTCGEKDGKAKAKKEGKAAEGKCGEGKCGEHKADSKDGKSSMKMKAGKAAEGKCGEGKCGEKSGKSEKKSDE